MKEITFGQWLAIPDKVVKPECPERQNILGRETTVCVDRDQQGNAIAVRLYSMLQPGCYADQYFDLRPESA